MAGSNWVSGRQGIERLCKCVCMLKTAKDRERQLCNVNLIEYFCNISCKYSTLSIRHVSDIDGCSAQKETY